MMKVTQVSIRATEAALAAGRPELTPELLAASGARYSRNNEGLEAILAKIDPLNLDQSVDSIFKMIDYGHQSISDMVPVAMFIDGISIWLAYYVWALCPTAGGQESSTRYIKLSAEGLVSPGDLGLPESLHTQWQKFMEECFSAYQESLQLWEKVASKNPEVARIPDDLLSESTEKAQKQVARMKRNYGFDRARYFLPVAASTNMMLIMSARGWVQLCQYLLSDSRQEAQTLGNFIRDELRLSAPRMIKHALRKNSISDGLRLDFSALKKKYLDEEHEFSLDQLAMSPNAKIHVMVPQDEIATSFAEDLQLHDNRYAWIGQRLKRTAVRFGWDAVAFAELRDLNRHRTGNKFSPLIPQGFYCASDQFPSDAKDFEAVLTQLSESGKKSLDYIVQHLKEDDPNFIYWAVLGTQFPFEHTTTADKFIYEAELRTGTGAHFRYAAHFHEVLAHWYDMFPETRGLVLEGGAEPE